MRIDIHASTWTSAADRRVRRLDRPRALPHLAYRSPETEPTCEVPRRHLVSGTYNLRDVGGYRAATGSVRRNRLLRSDALHRLDSDGRRALVELGVRRVVDLRDPWEVDDAPSRLDGMDVDVVHLPVFGTTAPRQLAALSANLEELYDLMVEQHAGNLARALRAVAEPDQTVLVHCTAGKDRTGVVVALALLAVGVERADIVADYTATEENLRGEWGRAVRARLEAAGIVVGPDADRLVAATPALIGRVVDRIRAEHGSVTAYLLHAGLTPADLDRLRTGLVEPSDRTVDRMSEDRT